MKDMHSISDELLPSSHHPITIIISSVVINDINIVFNMTVIIFINNVPKKAALGNCIPTDAGQPLSETQERKRAPGLQAWARQPLRSL